MYTHYRILSNLRLNYLGILCSTKSGNTGHSIDICYRCNGVTTQASDHATLGGDRVKWLRRQNGMENYFETLQRKGFYLSAYWLTLSSVAPLKEDDVRQALVHLYRKVPHLRLCFRQRDDGKFWACEKDGDNINFEVIRNRDPADVMQETLNQSYNSHEGPLWRARLVYGGAGEESPLEELRSSFPHTAHLILGNHHGIADGFSNSTTYNLLLKILNDVIAGKPIDDEEQLGHSVDLSPLVKMVKNKTAELKENPESTQRLINQYITYRENIPLLLQCRPPKQDAPHRTDLLFEVLDKETTREFLLKCREEGVSVGSAFTALANGTTVDFARNSDLKEQKSYQLLESHIVNLRRLFAEDASIAMGVFIEHVKNTVQTPITWRESFWEYTRNLHQNLQAEFTADGFMKERCIQTMMKFNVEEILQNLPTPHIDTMTTNMGDLDSKFTQRGEYIQVSRVHRGSSCLQEFGIHFFHTFRGRFHYCYNYCPKYLSEDVAMEFTQALFRNLRDLI